MDSNEIDNLMKGIRGWLSTKGYPLEMEVAGVFRDSGFGVRQGWYYDDPETGTSREQDVLVTHQIAEKNILVFQLVIECKRSRDPFVEFTYGPDLSKSAALSWVPSNHLGREFLQALRSAKILERLPIYEPTSPIGYSVVQARISGDKQKRGGVDAAYEALMTATKASYSLSQLYSTKVTDIQHDPETDELLPVVYLGLPVIVIDAPLFECYLGEDNELVVNHLHQLSIEWSFPAVGTLMLNLVSRAALENLVKGVSETMVILNEEARGLLSSLQAPPYVASS